MGGSPPLYGRRIMSAVDFSIDRNRRVAGSEITDAEWAVRVDLAAAYRLCARHGWDDLIQGHLSVRVPGTPNHFLINPYGMAFEEITASSLVKIDDEARIVGHSDYPVNGAGFVIHSAVHMGRPELHCVIHLHSEAGMALSMLQEGLLPLTQHALRFYKRIGYHAYEGVAVDLDERKSILRDLGPHKAMILQSHGVLTAGETVQEAWVLMYYLMTAINAQLKAMAASDNIVVPSEEVCEWTAKLWDSPKMSKGELEWPAMLRRLDREDTSYRS
jgi:ribulose-5-phosphate 4-epimerase/fuculose-1-phosphate aldolase